MAEPAPMKGSVKGSSAENKAWKDVFIQLKGSHILISKGPADSPMITLDASHFNTLVTSADDGSRAFNWLLSNVDDTSAEHWTISCGSKENSDALEAAIRPNLSPVGVTPLTGSRRQTVKTQPVEDDNVPESVKKLRQHFRAKEDMYEKQRITSHLELEKRVTERITSLKKKMAEDLRQYGEEDVSIVNLISHNATEIILLLTEHLHNRAQHFWNLKNQKVKTMEDVLAKVSRLATTIPVPSVSEFIKCVTEGNAEYSQQLTTDVNQLIDRYDQAGKLREADLSIHITELEKTKQKDKSHYYIEQYQLMMGVLKFLRTDTTQLLEDELSVLTNDSKADTQFLQDNFK